MKPIFDFIKIIGFMVACGVLADYIRYYIIASHFSTYSIVGGVTVQILVIVSLYKLFIE
jgi:hypothetical protein